MKCEKKGCNKERVCFHYCHEHHQEICMSNNPCQHLNRVGDNYGESCADCGKQLSGYGWGGFFGINLTGRETCIHLYAPMGSPATVEICIYCQDMREIKSIKIKPKSDCKACHGTGEVNDWVDYGSTSVPMPSVCDCVLDQIPEGLEGVEVEIDRS